MKQGSINNITIDNDKENDVVHLFRIKKFEDLLNSDYVDMNKLKKFMLEWYP